MYGSFRILPDRYLNCPEILRSWTTSWEQAVSILLLRHLSSSSLASSLPVATRQLIGLARTHLAGTGSRALLLVGYAGDLRRSELAV